MEGIVSHNLAVAHVSRYEIIQQRTRPLAQEMFPNIESTSAMLVLDEIYINTQ